MGQQQHCGKGINLNGGELGFECTMNTKYQNTNYILNILNCLNWEKIYCIFSQWKLESVLTVIFSALITGILVLLPYILKFKYLISHFYYGVNLQESLDEN